MDGFVELGYIGLFLAAFLAGSVVPLSSEVVFSALIAAGLNSWWCLAIATAGNFLGAMTCFFIGRMGRIDWIEKYLKIKKEKIEKAKNMVQGKKVVLMSFFCFVPIIGDLIVVALGLLRANVWIVATSILVGKFIRYYVWMIVTLGVLDWLKW